MVTIKDVAKHANVSVATVSRVVRGIGYFSEETYSKVQSACNELGYIANSTAQKLKSKNLGTVGYIISDINNQFYIAIAAELQRVLAANGLELVLAFSSEKHVDEEHAFRYLISCQVSTILFTPTSNKNGDTIRIAQQNGIKVVQLFRKIYDNLDTVYNDDEQGCADLVKYLVAHGKKRILLLDVCYPSVDYADVVPSREAGLSTVDVGDARTHVAHVGLLGHNQQAVASEIECFDPDAVIAATGVVAVDVLQYAKHNKCDFELVSFDDNPWLDVCGVTALRQPTTETAETIWNLINTDDETPRTVVLKQTLICRN